MTTIPILQYQEAELVMNDDGQFLCEHEDAYIEKACCTTVGSSGYIECGCGGRDSVVCEASNCTGIEDFQVDALFDRLTPDPADYYED